MNLIRGRSKTNILLIEAPPRHGKSELVSKWFPSWYLMRRPNSRVIISSYADDLAVHFGRQCRNIVNEYSHWFGLHGVGGDNNRAAEWTLAGFEGSLKSSGRKGGITGRGAHLFVIDDLIKNHEEALSQTVRDSCWNFFQSVALTRMEPGGCVVVMATRWHEDDLTGRIMQRSEAGELVNDQGQKMAAKLLTLRAIAEEDDPLGRQPGEALWPERYPIGALQARKAIMDSFWWNALFQARCGQYGGAEWPDEYFREPYWVEDDANWPDRFEWSVLVLDPSKGKTARSDYQALVFLGFTRGKLFVRSWLEREGTPAMITRLIETYRSHQPDRVGIESNSWQDLLQPLVAQELTRLKLPPMPISLIHNSADKKVRINGLGRHLRDHNFRFARMPGNVLMTRQLKDHPFGDYDDGPDALEMALRLINHISRT